VRRMVMRKEGEREREREGEREKGNKDRRIKEKRIPFHLLPFKSDSLIEQHTVDRLRTEMERDTEAL
jgi:hypothetical protein